jgi:hypothetical protein
MGTVAYSSLKDLKYDKTHEQGFFVASGARSGNRRQRWRSPVKAERVIVVTVDLANRMVGFRASTPLNVAEALDLSDQLRKAANYIAIAQQMGGPANASPTEAETPAGGKA